MTDDKSVMHDKCMLGRQYFTMQHTTDVHMCSEVAFHMRKLPFAALMLVSCVRAAWHILYMKVICARINKGWTACCS